jgi:hypothetical protein
MRRPQISREPFQAPRLEWHQFPSLTEPVQQRFKLWGFVM